MRHLAFAALCGLVATQASAAVFLDDFSADTSANYTKTNAVTGSFAVSGGTLNVNNTTETSSSINILHETAQLEVGETALVDILTNPREVMLIVSTQLLQPNASGPSGIRLSANTESGNLRARGYNSSSSAVFDQTSGSIIGIDTLFIFRETETTFDVGYDNGSGLTVFQNDVTLTGASGAEGMYIGIQFFEDETSQDFVVDNLQIVPEPTSVALLGLGGLLGLRRRRA